MTPLTQSVIVVTDSEWNVEKSVSDKGCTRTCEGASGPIAISARAQSLSKTELAAAILTTYNL